MKLIRTIVDFDGNVEKELTTGKILSSYLLDISSENAEEIYKIAEWLHKGEEIEVSNETLMQITEIVRNSNIANRYKAPILKELHNA